jgi:hypothetical protein
VATGPGLRHTSVHTLQFNGLHNHPQSVFVVTSVERHLADETYCLVSDLMFVVGSFEAGL